MKYTKRFQNAQALSVPVKNNYSEDKLMNIFLYNFHQDGKYTAQISSQQAELRIEEKFTDQKYLSIISLQKNYLNIGRSSGSGINIERVNCVHTKYTFCGGANHSAENVLKR